MGRKHLLDGLAASDELTAVNSVGPEVSSPASVQATPLAGMGSRGAIGAVTRSIEQMRANAIADLAPELVVGSPITDRLGGTQEDHRALVDSIREHGQQVPILVRPHPEREGFYQIAYGRRRLRALAELGRSVRAIIRPMTDQQLVVAQGQENTARTDLSYIERALFAAKLEQGGYDRETIMAALSVDKTTLSRLISAVNKVPRNIIEAIGPAPRAGRDRWIELAVRLEATGRLERVKQLIEEPSFIAKSSDERFMGVFTVATAQSAKATRPKLVKATDGTLIARIKDDTNSLTVALDKKTNGDFCAHLVELLPDLYAAFKSHNNQIIRDEEERSNL